MVFRKFALENLGCIFFVPYCLTPNGFSVASGIKQAAEVRTPVFPVHNSRRIMNTANNTPCGLTAALSIAYKTVMTLGYTHKKLADTIIGVNRTTLLRIKKGLAGKEVTDLFYLETFLKIIDTVYWEHVGSNTNLAKYLLKVMREILLAEHCLLNKGRTPCQ